MGRYYNQKNGAIFVYVLLKVCEMGSEITILTISMKVERLNLISKTSNKKELQLCTVDI